MMIVRWTRRAALVLLALLLGAAVLAPAPAAEAYSTAHGLHYCRSHNSQVYNGVRGDCVAAVQQFLRMNINGQMYGPRCNGYLAGAGWIGIDGIAGRQTDRYIRCFQMEHRLSVDGVVGPATYGAMLASCKGTYYVSVHPERHASIPANWACAR